MGDDFPVGRQPAPGTISKVIMPMRWLFVGIVVLNILYFGWSLATKDSAHGPVASAARLAGGAYPAQLQLLDPAAGVQQALVGAPVIAGVEVGCPAIGPIPDEAKAVEVARVLTEQGVSAAPYKAEDESVPVYWVYLAPVGGRQQALRKLRELHAAGVDSFIVADGADENSISLGSFSVRDSAIGLQARLRSAGYPAQVREQLKMASRFWVVVESPVAQGFLEFVPRSLQGSLRTERKPCPKGL